MRWDHQNYLAIRGFCYIRPLYNEVPLYMMLDMWCLDAHLKVSWVCMCNCLISKYWFWINYWVFIWKFCSCINLFSVLYTHISYATCRSIQDVERQNKFERSNNLEVTYPTNKVVCVCMLSLMISGVRIGVIHASAVPSGFFFKFI